MITKTHTVSCRSYHPAARQWKLYDHAASKIEYVTDVTVELDKIDDPLARFLAAHAPKWLAGGHINFKMTDRVRCWNGRTEAEMVVAERKPYAENLIKIYGLNSIPCQIDDWRMAQAEAGDDGVRYWTRAANQMRTAGVELVQIGDAVFFV